MEKIDRYISELLHENECVIVPKLGAFISSKGPVGQLPPKHSFKLSSGEITFNVLLNHNDGLLASHVAKHEGLVELDAQKRIKEFTDEFHQILNSGKKFVIEHVGVFSKDEMGNLRFETVQQVNETSIPIANTVKQIYPLPEKKINKEEYKIEEKPVIVLPFKQQKQKPKRSKWSKNDSVNVVLLIGSLLIFGWELYSVLTYKMKFVQTNTITNGTTTGQPVVLNNPAINSETPGSSPEVNHKSDVATVSKKIEELDSKLTATSKTPKEVLPSGKAKSYFIIAGAFKSLDNAKRKQGELQSLGFKNARVIDEKASLLMVCYDRFSSLEKANEILKNIKAKDNHAWIFSQ